MSFSEDYDDGVRADAIRYKKQCEILHNYLNFILPFVGVELTHLPPEDQQIWDEIWRWHERHKNCVFVPKEYV